MRMSNVPQERVSMHQPVISEEEELPTFKRDRGITDLRLREQTFNSPSQGLRPPDSDEGPLTSRDRLERPYPKSSVIHSQRMKYSEMLDF